MKFVPSVLTTTEAHMLEETTASELKLDDPTKEFIGALFDKWAKESNNKHWDKIKSNEIVLKRKSDKS